MEKMKHFATNALEIALGAIILDAVILLAFFQF